MTDIMYEIPSRDDVEKCVITKETITEDAKPILIEEKKGEIEAS